MSSLTCNFSPNRGRYSDGKLLETVTLCAGNKGTIIKAEDLFYNVPTRRKALKSASDEHNALARIVIKFVSNTCSIFIF